MYYFAYGSNLNKKQMKKRCKDSVFVKKMVLKDYKLTFRSKYGAADIDKKTKGKVYGALYQISKKDEKRLDIYEEYPKLYKKLYFKANNKKIMLYIMCKKTKKMSPSTRYLNTIKQGYKDHNLKKTCLDEALLQLKHF